MVVRSNERDENSPSLLTDLAPGPRVLIGLGRLSIDRCDSTIDARCSTTRSGRAPVLLQTMEGRGVKTRREHRERRREERE